MSMRTARGPVVVAFYRGTWAEEDVEYFKALAEREDEFNRAAGSLVGIGVGSLDEARNFVEQSDISSYVLYDYTKAASREWGTLEKDKEHGEYARPAVFMVDTNREIVHAWTDERPDGDELLRKITAITGLPEPLEEEDEEAEEEENQQIEATEPESEESAQEQGPQEAEDDDADSEPGGSGSEGSSEQDSPEAQTEDEKKAGE